MAADNASKPRLLKSRIPQSGRGIPIARNALNGSQCEILLSPKDRREYRDLSLRFEIPEKRTMTKPAVLYPSAVHGSAQPAAAALLLSRRSTCFSAPGH